MKQPDALAVIDEHHSPTTRLTYKELHGEICTFARGLRFLGLERGARLSIFSENGSRLLICDQGAMMLGASNAMRGVTSPPAELVYIFENSESVGIAVQDWATLQSISSELRRSRSLGKLKFVAVLWPETKDLDALSAKKSEFAADLAAPIFTFDEVLAVGLQQHGSSSEATQIDCEKHDVSEVASIIYTSGTTGNPKGVMLTHGNLMHQICNLNNVIAMIPGARTLSLLPPWHVYQLATGYYAYSGGICNRYSDVNHFRQDLADFGTDFLVAVPLVVENLYKRIQSQIRSQPATKRAVADFLIKLGVAYTRARRIVTGSCVDYALTQPKFFFLVRLAAALKCLLLLPLYKLAKKLVFSGIRSKINIQRVVVSGGGSLAQYLEDFFETVGLEIINGWGLTETAPVLAARSTSDIAEGGVNARGTIGFPVPGSQVKVVDPETGEEVDDGKTGLMLARGPNVFAGYCGNEEETAKAFRFGDGWFDTGDLGYKIPAMPRAHKMGGMLVHVGREKETIVLLNGENVEPNPLENACLASPLISQMMIVGQDRKHLGAVIVPDWEHIKDAGIAAEDVEAKVVAEVRDRIQQRPTFKVAEAVRKFLLLDAPFTYEDGTLTRTMKLRRHVIAERLEEKINAMFQI